MKIEVLGTGCAKCKQLYAAAAEAVQESGVEAELAKVEKLDEIIAKGVMRTPALVVDGEVKSVGKVLTKDEIVALFPKA